MSAVKALSQNNTDPGSFNVWACSIGSEMASTYLIRIAQGSPKRSLPAGPMNSDPAVTVKATPL
ncbi:hypothetical protein BJ994_003449 [Arthrobacter pigmenti]|uniref:Uncharacterized protein n=1 Tax=Arthrobacter pigmenti TaxID=271432 RepID=A0A846RMA2_9MICC|nr:hypothetical protein [Arthrobacter pigmenti]